MYKRYCNCRKIYRSLERSVEAERRWLLGRCAQPSVRFSFPFRLMSFLFIRHDRSEKAGKHCLDRRDNVKIHPREDVTPVSTLLLRSLRSRLQGHAEKRRYIQIFFRKIRQKNQDLSKRHMSTNFHFSFSIEYIDENPPSPRKKES